MKGFAVQQACCLGKAFVVGLQQYLLQYINLSCNVCHCCLLYLHLLWTARWHGLLSLHDGELCLDLAQFKASYEALENT